MTNEDRYELLERACLSHMIADDDAAKHAVTLLKDDHFWHTKHILLFKELIKNISNCGSVNLNELFVQVGSHPAQVMLRTTIGEICTLRQPPTLAERDFHLLIQAAAERSTGNALTELSQMSLADPAEVATQMTKKAREITEMLPQTVKDPVKGLEGELDDAMAGRRYAVTMPWPMLSHATRALLPGTVTILCGSPGATKSLAMNQLIRWSSEMVKSALYVLEDGVVYHMRRAVAQLSCVSDLTDDSWCRNNPDEVKRLKQLYLPALRKLKGIFEQPTNMNACTVDDLLDWVRAKADDGCRVIAIDPITMMQKTRTGWLDDERFLSTSKRIIEKYGMSLVLVTHPKKLPFGASLANMSMDDMAGGSAYSRFTQTILMLLAHDQKEGPVESETGAKTEEYNRTMVVRKARNGRGVEGYRYAFWFDPKSLSLNELGRIRKEE
jgi:replicative DNA helicase